METHFYAMNEVLEKSPAGKSFLVEIRKIADEKLDKMMQDDIITYNKKKNK